VTYAGLAAGFVGLYQFNVTVPSISAGDWPVFVQTGGLNQKKTLYISVAQ
jgi:uncharacterized protein (TIGR03437 family)